MIVRLEQFFLISLIFIGRVVNRIIGIIREVDLGDRGFFEGDLLRFTGIDRFSSLIKPFEIEQDAGLFVYGHRKARHLIDVVH